MHMPIWLDKRALLTPNRIAVEGEGGSLTFAELQAQAENTARGLIAADVQPNEVIAVLSDSDHGYIALIHSIPYTGAKLMLLNHRLTVHELAYQLSDSGCVLLIYGPRYSAAAQQLQQSIDQLRIVPITELQSLTAAAAHVQLLRDVKEDATYTIMYTSGTTGHPKGVLQSYSNHFSSAIGSLLNLGLHEGDKWLVTMPLFHISGLSILLRSVIYGIPIVLQQKFTPEHANKAIMEQGVTIMSVVSNMLQRMLQELGGENYPSTFRCMLLGGGPAPLPLLEACVAKGIPVVQTYGMTETCSQFATLQPEYMLTKLGSAGKPLFQGELKIMMNDELQPPAAVGEIVVKGPNVTKGYLNQASSGSFQQDWFYTGDVGYLDEEGFLYVLDRRKDMLISGGENVYPAEIEAVLMSHPDVLEAGVTGVEDERWGQRAIAFVVLRSECKLDSEGLMHHCRQKLAKYKVPAGLYAVQQLPRNAANKLLRRELIKMLDDEARS